MSHYSSLHALTEKGLKIFEQVMTGQLPEAALDVARSDLAGPVSGSLAFEARSFGTAKEMAQAVCRSFGTVRPQDEAGNTGLWAWLTFVLIDTVFPMKDGQRQFKAPQRWYPSPPNDWQKAQRHLVRMPVLLYSAFGDDADHLICGRPSIGPEIREQLTSQQDMFTAGFQQACRRLYFDPETGSVKKGAGSKTGAGTTRRLAAVRLQLDVTWDMTDLSSDRILELLPAEFGRFLN